MIPLEINPQSPRSPGRVRGTPRRGFAAPWHAIALLLPLGLAGCGSGSSGSAVSVPGTPTIGTAAAGDASASIAFTAPASNGGATITAYTATCTSAASTKTGGGAASPITVSSLTNGTTYSCSVTATNSAGTGAASGSVSVTPAAGATGSTAGVECSYANDSYNSDPLVLAQSTVTWSCSATERSMVSNGIPDHSVGPFNIEADLDFAISAQSISAKMSLTPSISSTTGSFVQPSGYLLNGVKLDPGTGGSCSDTATSNDTTVSGTSTVGGCTLLGNAGQWRLEALGQTSFNFGADGNNAHVQPTGEYHYHGMPEGFITRLGKGEAMTLVGWAMDGYPMYARYAYSVAGDASSAIKVLTSSWQKKATPDSGRPATSIFPMGTFLQDYEYVAASGDLDECNGRTGVTPEFPAGTYYYMVTDTWPYVQRCIKGTSIAGGSGGPGGGPPPAP